MEHVDVVVAGAGIVGLSVARALAKSGRDVWVLEATDGIGNGASSRNSEVIHAGIYYPPGSLKARLCLQGKTLLYQYCHSRGIAHERIGKLIVATTATEISALRRIETNARANGLHDLIWLDAAKVAAMEPALKAECALWSPSTGIIDSHSLMLAYQGDAESAGASVICRAPILAGTLVANGILLDIGGDSTMRLRCNLLVNCAGLGATALAQAISGFPTPTIPALHLCKGSYFTLTKPAPFRHLIYPVPEPGGLGIHLTLDLAGQARFGPDVEWVSTMDYAVDSARADRFYPAIRRYWPRMEASILQPAYSGIRAKISGPGESSADFRIDDASFHGVPQVINLFGIESPGLTASLAIGTYVASLAQAMRK